MIAPGYIDDKSRIQKRLRRIEGQVRGIQGMVETDRYCVEVLDQIAATTRALQAVALELIDDHLSHCVANAVKQGGPAKDKKLKEASAAIARLVRS
jgi:DNA-binding FrmR family transcriptional regulator